MGSELQRAAIYRGRGPPERWAGAHLDRCGHRDGYETAAPVVVATHTKKAVRQGQEDDETHYLKVVYLKHTKVKGKITTVKEAFEEVGHQQFVPRKNDFGVQGTAHFDATKRHYGYLAGLP